MAVPKPPFMVQHGRVREVGREPASKTDEPAEGVSPESVPELESMTRAELYQYGSSIGADVKKAMSRYEFMDAIEDHIAGSE